MVEESDLVAANSGIWTAAVLCQIVLAPAAGLLVVTFGWGFALNAVSYFASAALLRSLRLPRTTTTTVRRRLSRDALEGARVLLADRLLRAMAIAQLLAALLAGATSALLVLYARQQLRTSASGHGTLLAAIGVGGVPRPSARATARTQPTSSAPGVRPDGTPGNRRPTAGRHLLASARGGGARRLRPRHLDRLRDVHLVAPGPDPGTVPRTGCWPRWTCCGRPAGWPRWRWAPW